MSFEAFMADGIIMFWAVAVGLAVIVWALSGAKR